MKTRRQFASSFALATLLAPPLIRAAYAADWPEIIVGKSETCGCCGDWVEHLRGAGLPVRVEVLEPAQLDQLKQRLGVSPALQSCHTGYAAGYVLEGHIPADDIKRLLTERPDALGLAVPGMPLGSPGMEYGNQRDAYSVILIGKDGSTSIYARHG
jgi:hypothetical protein